MTASNVPTVADVLAGHARCDDLPDDAQAAGRASWRKRLDAVSGGVDLTPMLTEAGLPWTEADLAGTVIMRTP